MSAPNDLIHVDVHSDRVVYPSTEDCLAYLLIEVVTTAPAPLREGLDVVAVVDGSPSTRSVERSTRVTQALEVLRKQLQSSDHLAVVSYAESSAVALDPTPAADVNADELHARLQSTFAQLGRGCRLSPGLLRALELLDELGRPRCGRSVFCLVDTLLEDADDCERVVRDLFATGTDLSINAIDQFSSHRSFAELLRAHGKKVNRFDQLDLLVAAMRDDLSVARKTVAHNLLIELRLVPAVVCGEAFRYRPVELMLGQAESGGFRFRIAAIEAGVKHSYMVELRLPACAAGMQTWGELVLQFAKDGAQFEYSVPITTRHDSDTGTLEPDAPSRVTRIRDVFMRRPGNSRREQLAMYSAKLQLYIAEHRDESLIAAVQRKLHDLERPEQPPRGTLSDERYLLARTNTSMELPPAFDVVSDPTPGLVLIFCRLHAHLPSAVPFAVPSVSIGREADNTLSIPEAAVSRYHARFERRPDGRTWVVDTQSTNGTFVNGRRVRELPLSAHDVVRIGDTLFRFVDHGIYGYGAYRIDGTIVRQARPFMHGVEKSLLVGGYQIDAVLDKIAKVAQSNISVVVAGEIGTGKELVAREIHRLSGRKGAFQAINCAAIPENLIESELFGYRRGAFSGAISDKTGHVRAANGGTLFLDEVGDMPMEAQAKLLRVLQEKEVVPLGAADPEKVDVRVVCATHRDLTAREAEGLFRGDLHGRLRELSVRLPSLRERLEDLYPLVLYFLSKHGKSETEVSFPVILALAHYRWPYNVRELESAVRLAATLSAGGPLDLLHLPEPVRRSLDRHGAPADPGPKADADRLGESTFRTTQPPLIPKPKTRAEAPSEEKLRELLTRHHGNIAAVGRELGKERGQIHRYLSRYNLDIEEFRR